MTPQFVSRASIFFPFLIAFPPFRPELKIRLHFNAVDMRRAVVSASATQPKPGFCFKSLSGPKTMHEKRVMEKFCHDLFWFFFYFDFLLSLTRPDSYARLLLRLLFRLSAIFCCYRLLLAHPSKFTHSIKTSFARDGCVLLRTWTTSQQGERVRRSERET